ncbi:MAG: GlxA family transcriptional regulator [Deltaproteobacteria bacterium]|nr:GlxA family transcriptional regulator [Deltaproteobacteria bacterium]
MSNRNGKQESERTAGIVRVPRQRGEQTHDVLRRIALVAYPDFEPLDLTGPFSVFAGTARWLREVQGVKHETYTVEVLGTEVGPLRAAGGLGILVDRSFHTIRDGIDTLLVAGGPGTRRALHNDELLAWLRRIAPRVRRLGSVCTGSFILAEAGLLDGRRATTHWAWGTELARLYPRVLVDADPIFIRDGNIYTSAGVTAGMDLALALVEEDYGREVALQIARNLVLYLRRPGGQSQFSTLLVAQGSSREPLRELQTWIAENLETDLSVLALARRVAMSPRHFARVFTHEVGMPPGQFVEKMRVEAARRRLEESPQGVKVVAVDCGFGSTDTMRRAFLRTLRVAPIAYRSRFRATAA